VLCETDQGFVLLDGALAEYLRVGDSRADYSAEYRRLGANAQVVTDRPAPIASSGGRLPRAGSLA
jgi:hypothetical protein